MRASRGLLSVAIFIVCCSSINASPFIGQFVDLFKNTGNLVLAGFGEAIKPWNALFESAEKYIQRYLSESINNLQQKADAIATLQVNSKKLSDYIIDARKNGDDLAKSTNLTITNGFGSVDLAIKIASRKSSDCAKKGQEKKDKLLISFNSRINAALKTLDTFNQIESDIYDINVRLDKSKNINNSITAMRECAKNVNINVFNAPKIANCIAQIGIAFFAFFTDNSGSVETRLVNVQKRTQDVVTNFNALFKDIKSDAETQAKQTADEILTCAGITTNSSQYLNDILKDIKEKETRTESFFAQISAGLTNLKFSANGYITKVEANIKKAVEPLFVAIAATLKRFPNRDLSKEQEKLKKFIEEGKFRTNITVLWDIIKGLNESGIDLQVIISEFRKYVVQFSVNYFETQCKKGIVLDLEFRFCVEDLYQQFLDFFDFSFKGITGINYKFGNITLQYNGYINIKFDLQFLFNWSNEAGNAVYTNNQITGQDILDYAIKMNTYNITPILETILNVNASAKELDKRNTISLSNGNSTLFASGGAIYDISGPGRVYCNQKTIDEKLKSAQILITERQNYILSKAPVLSPTISELLQQAATVSTTLYAEIAKLDQERLKTVCPSSSTNTESLFTSYQCIEKEVNKFGAYYESEIEKIKNYTKDAQTKLDSATIALNNWRIQYVLPEAEAIKQKLKLESESFYNQCNITIEKLINFALSVAQSHYANFQVRITSVYLEVIALADLIMSRNYTGYNITARLDAATEPLSRAINAVLASKNSSIITSEVYQAKTNLFNEAKIKFDKVLANFSIIAKLYKESATNLLQKREEIQKNLNYSNVYSICYNPSSSTPLTDLINCALGQVYSRVFVEGNNRTLTILLDMKLVLVRFDTNSTGVIQESADFIVEEYSRNIYFSAYTLYKLAGLTVPSDILAKVEGNKCIQGVNANKYYCVITT